MKKYILFTLIICTYAFSDNKTIQQRSYEYELALQEEIELEQVMTRYPSFINDLYESAKEGFRDLNEGLWSLAGMFGAYILPDHTFSTTTASVRHAPHNELCYEEEQYIHIRTPHVRKALEKLLDMKLSNQETPRIALCFSGGGFRSMLLTLGFLKGAQDIGLFDASMFMSGLSGSTWAIAPWIASNEPMDVYLDGLFEKIEEGLDHINDEEEIKLFMHQLMTKILYKQPISSIDIYGALIANTLLVDADNNRLHTTITDSHKDVLMGFLPLPIYTSIQTNEIPYEWMECTPFEIGSDHLQAYIPTWAYGRKFQDGTSIDFAPEQSLGYFLGIFGSAFAVNFNDILYFTHDQMTEIKQQLPYLLQSYATDLIDCIAHSPLNDFRLFPSMLRNYTYNLNWSPLSKDKHICLVDAGIDFNLPIPPLLRKGRNVDVIIVYDASGTIEGAPELKRLASYAQRKKLPLPDINYQSVDKNLVSIFKSEDPETPIIIYFPRLANPDYADFDPDYCIEHAYCNTMNFTYMQEQSKELFRLAEFTLTQHKELIKSTLKEAIERKRQAPMP